MVRRVGSSESFLFLMEIRARALTKVVPSFASDGAGGTGGGVGVYEPLSAFRVDAERERSQEGRRYVSFFSRKSTRTYKVQGVCILCQCRRGESVSDCG